MRRQEQDPSLVPPHSSVLRVRSDIGDDAQKLLLLSAMCPLMCPKMCHLERTWNAHCRLAHDLAACHQPQSRPSLHPSAGRQPIHTHMPPIHTHMPPPHTPMHTYTLLWRLSTALSSSSPWPLPPTPRRPLPPWSPGPWPGHFGLSTPLSSSRAAGIRSAVRLPPDGRTGLAMSSWGEGEGAGEGEGVGVGEGGGGGEGGGEGEGER